MLLDRGLLVQEGNVYRPTGPIEKLEVPETLQALIAARLDSLTPQERKLVQDGAVLGKTFTKFGLAHLSGLPESELEPLLNSLLRKEVLSIQADPRSPERGQYSFLQDVVRRVGSHDTISKKDRKTKHLAAARFLSSAWSGEEDEIVEVVAAHYFDAYEAAPTDADAERSALGRTRCWCARATGQRRSARISRPSAHSSARPVSLTICCIPAELEERAGMMASAGCDQTARRRTIERAIELFEGAARRIRLPASLLGWPRSSGIGGDSKRDSRA